MYVSRGLRSSSAPATATSMTATSSQSRRQPEKKKNMIDNKADLVEPLGSDRVLAEQIWRDLPRNLFSLDEVGVLFITCVG